MYTLSVMDKIEPISEIRAHLPEVVTRVKEEGTRYIVTRQGKAAAVIISPEELETLEILSDRKLLQSLIRAESDVKGKHLYSHKDVFGV